MTVVVTYTGICHLHKNEKLLVFLWRSAKIINIEFKTSRVSQLVGCETKIGLKTVTKPFNWPKT